MDDDLNILRAFWHLFDAVALAQNKRAATHLEMLAPKASASPHEALTTMAALCALAVDEATALTAEAQGIDPSLARMDVLRSIGRRVNGASSIAEPPPLDGLSHDSAASRSVRLPRSRRSR